MKKIETNGTERKSKMVESLLRRKRKAATSKEDRQGSRRGGEKKGGRCLPEGKRKKSEINYDEKKREG